MSTQQNTDSSGQEGKYAQHTQVDAAFASRTQEVKRPGLTVVGRIAVFIGFPTLVGFIGLYMGYLAQTQDPNRAISFDRDFAMPFVLALSMVVVIGLQTKGYTSPQVEPLVSWPKVKKRKKIVHKHVVVNDGKDEKQN